MIKDLQKNWIISYLSEVASLIRGVSYDKSDLGTNDNAHTALLRANNIQDGNLIFDDMQYVLSTVVDETQHMRKFDILIAMSSGSKKLVGKTAQYMDNENYLTFGAFCSVVRPNQYINPKFLGFFFQSDDYRKVVSNASKGVNINNLKNSDITNIEIPLPPLAEQGRIVAKIEELFAGIDAGVENLKAVKNQIALYRQSVLKSAFDGTLYKTTEWNIDVLKNLCSVISDGDHQPPPKAKNGIPFIMISNINKNLINFEDTNFVSENYYTSLSEKRKPKWGDVLYSVVGSYGIPVLIDFQKEFCFQRHIALLRPNTNKIFSKFLFYMLRSRNVYNQVTDCSTGTAQKTVPLSGLREIHIPVPTLAEQERIVAEIESRFERADALETAVDRALSNAEKLKQAVLKKAFSGELVPQNPDDEPASVLLDRIRAARASELPAKKGKRK